MSVFQTSIPRKLLGNKKGIFIKMFGLIILATWLWINKNPLHGLYTIKGKEPGTIKGRHSSLQSTPFIKEDTNSLGVTLSNTVTSSERPDDLQVGRGNTSGEEPVTIKDMHPSPHSTFFIEEKKYSQFLLSGESKLQNTTLSNPVKSLEHPENLQTEGKTLADGHSFQLWKNLLGPGKYIGCINFLDSFEKKGNMIQVGDNHQMTVERCLTQCNAKKLTYAGLLDGTQCHCIKFTGSMDSFYYVSTSQCNIPCYGEKNYDCGGRNGTYSLYRTKVPDSRCSKVRLKPKGSMPLIALASFPRSGNTWTRQLLEHATGIYTGSIYWRSEQRKAGSKILRGGSIPYNTGSTLCTKAHVFNPETIKKFRGGTILLIRNPYRSIVSEAIRLHSGSNRRGKKFIEKKGWSKFVKRSTYRWLATAVKWCTYSKRILVVRYEDLQKNTSKELIRMVQFLKQPLDMTRITCAVQGLPSSQSTGVSLGSFGRSSKTYLTFDPFTRSMHKLLDHHIATVNSTLKRHGHAPLPKYDKTPV